MDPAALPGLADQLSRPRLAPYLVATGGDQAQALRLYTWNVEVTAVFWGGLHALEVGLRNAIHNRLRTRYRRPDWWEAPNIRLHPDHRKMIEEAARRAQKAATRNQRPVVSDDVVAAATFGLWVALLGSARSYQYETQLWQPELVHAFPRYAGTRADLHRQLESVRLFRNRLAHHEPVFRRHLAADDRTVADLAGFIDADLQTYIETHSRVTGVVAKKSAVIASGTGSSF